MHVTRSSFTFILATLTAVAPSFIGSAAAAFELDRFFWCSEYAKPSVRMKFKVSREEYEAQRPHLRNLQDTYFILPSNDGEAYRAVELLHGVNAPFVRNSGQSWGAVLKKERLSPFELTDLRRRGIKKIAIFEIPGVAEEKYLESLGFQVVIFDHHHYAEVDRVNPESSLEQLMKYIGWKPNKIDLAIAVNDRGYIPGLKRLGLTNEEIREVRTYDFLAQGKREFEIFESMKRSAEIIPKMKKVGKAFVIDSSELPGVDTSILNQELAIQAADGKVDTFELSPHRVGYSGDPAIVQEFFLIDFEALGYRQGEYKKYGGGDPKESMFFGFKPDVPRSFFGMGSDTPVIPENVLEVFRSIIRKHSL